MSTPARPAALAATLRALRAHTGITGTEAARRAGLSQSGLSRLETGRRAPTADEIKALCKAYDAAPDVRAGLLQTANDLEPGTRPTRIVIQRGAHKFQERIGRIEESSELLRSYQPAMVIGLTQTTEYARAAMADARGDLDQLVQARIARQAILATNRRFVLIHTEGALLWHAGSPEVMAGQLDHLTALSERPNISLGVITHERPVSFATTHGFHLYDAKAALVGTVSGTAIITDPRDVDAYATEFAQIEAAAVFGHEARDVFARLASQYRALPPMPSRRTQQPDLGPLGPDIDLDAQDVRDSQGQRITEADAERIATETLQDRASD